MNRDDARLRPQAPFYFIGAILAGNNTGMAEADATRHCIMNDLGTAGVMRGSALFLSCQLFLPAHCDPGQFQAKYYPNERGELLTLR
jgi:hypothetical protein